jgi:hypothetical protein
MVEPPDSVEDELALRGHPVPALTQPLGQFTVLHACQCRQGYARCRVAQM